MVIELGRDNMKRLSSRFWIVFTRRFIPFLVVLILLQYAPESVHLAKADAAPPPPPLGSDIFPSIGNTNVRMMSEYVLLDIAGNSNYRSGHANVTAHFFMRNLGDTEEHMTVRFPMNHKEYEFEFELTTSEEFCDYSPYPSLEGLAVWVNGEIVEVEISYETMLDYMAPPNDENRTEYITVPCWAYFDVTFPPNEDVEIKVAYTVSGYDFNGRFSGEVEFAYVLGTGIGWKDTIGKADIVARLPYDVNDLNVAECYPEDCLISGKEISWHYEDFEPEGNITFRIVRTSIWQRILFETDNIQENPNDGDAWGRLGKAYKEAITGGKGMIGFYKPRSHTMFDLARDSYQKAIELLPDDEDWQYGYADLLCNLAMWNESTVENWIECVKPLKKSLDLNPDHEKGNLLLVSIFNYQDWDRINLEIVDISGPEPDYLILTPRVYPTATGTPLPSPTQTRVNRTKTPTPEATEEPTTSATNTPTPESTKTPQSRNSEIPTISTQESLSNPNNSTSVLIVLLGGALVLFVSVFFISRMRNR